MSKQPKSPRAAAPIAEAAETEAEIRGLRADLYAFLASLIDAAPDAERLAAIAQLSGDDHEIGAAIRSLALAAEAGDAAALEAEREAALARAGRDGADAAAGLSAMAGLLRGRLGGPPDRETQAKFFSMSLSPWMAPFFTALEADEDAPFYGALGALGRLLAEMEHEALLEDG